jgi:hypothetical protein
LAPLSPHGLVLIPNKIYKMICTSYLVYAVESTKSITTFGTPASQSCLIYFRVAATAAKTGSWVIIHQHRIKLSITEINSQQF